MKTLLVDDKQDMEDFYDQKFRKEIRIGGWGLLFAFSGKEEVEILESN